MSEDQLQHSQAYGMSAPSDPSSNTKWLLNNRIMKMNDAEASQEWYKFFVYFKFCIRRLSRRLPPEVGEAIEADWKRFYEVTWQLEHDTRLAETTKKMKIEELQRNFAEMHMEYIFYALPKAGLDVINEEASLNCPKHDFDEMKDLIRGSSVKSEMQDDEEAIEEVEKDGATATAATAGTTP